MSRKKNTYIIIHYFYILVPSQKCSEKSIAIGI